MSNNVENKSNTKLAAPWIVYSNQIKAMFKKDPDITFEYDDNIKTVTLRVNGDDKASALATLLPAEVEFGNVTLKIKVIPSNDTTTEKIDLFRKAFSGNPAISRFVTADTLWGSLNFVVFKPKVVQYYNDQLYDINGLKTTIYQDLAQELFGDNGIFFCTDKVDE